MRRLLVTSIALAFVLAAGPGTAAGESPTTVVSDNENDLLLKAYDTAMFAKRFDEALAKARMLHPDNPEAKAFVAAMEASAMLGLHRDREARALRATAEQLAPSSPDPSRVLFLGALITDHPEFAADALDVLIARAPDIVRGLDRDSMSFFLHNEPKDQERQNEDRRIMLARIGYGGETDYGHSLAFGAVKLLVDHGNIAEASDLLRYVKEPQYYENMLIQKRYSVLWPKLQDLGGERLAKVRAGAVEAAERAYEAAPEDRQNLQAYVDALRHAGRLSDAIALKSKLPATPEALSTADEKTGWVVNSLANAFYESGRGDEGDQLFAMLTDPPRIDAGWRVSMIINRLEMLTTAGKFEKAATLLDATERSAKDDGNAFAQQLVRRLRYCILSSIGKKDEAAKGLAEMLKYADDALQPTVEGLICAGNGDKAEELALKALNSAEKPKRDWFEQQFVRALQPVPLTDDDPSVWANSWVALRHRPAIAAIYDRLGRDLPAEMLLQKPIGVAAN